MSDMTSLEGGERLDVIGLLMSKKMKTGNPAKVEVWLRDESNTDFLVELWGPTFCQLASSLTEGVNVLQVDNARAIRKETGAVHVTAEFFADSDKGSSWAHSDPPWAPQGPLDL